MNHSLQKELDWYLEHLSPRSTNVEIRNTLFNIQMAINANDYASARSMLNSLGQIGGHVLKDHITIKDKTYMVHGLLLQSQQSGNFYLYDLDANDITYSLPMDGPKPLKQVDKEKSLIYLQPPPAPSTAAAATTAAYVPIASSAATTPAKRAASTAYAPDASQSPHPFTTQGAAQAPIQPYPVARARAQSMYTPAPSAPANAGTMSPFIQRPYDVVPEIPETRTTQRKSQYIPTDAPLK